jgi:hypothetical protein
MEVASSTKYAGGIVASSKYDTAITTVTNSGEIDVSGYGLAIGTAAFGNGNVYVTNSGTIDVTSETTYAVGVGAYSKYADVSVTNSGSLSVMGYAGATGITAECPGRLLDRHHGRRQLHRRRVLLQLDRHLCGRLAGATVTSAGEVYAHTGGLALGGSSFTSTGIEAYSAGGDAAVINSGSVEAVSDGYTDFGSMLATGIYVYANDYDASVTNSGTVIADASGYAFLRHHRRRHRRDGAQRRRHGHQLRHGHRDCLRLRLLLRRGRLRHQRLFHRRRRGHHELRFGRCQRRKRFLLRERVLCLRPARLWHFRLLLQR